MNDHRVNVINRMLRLARTFSLSALAGFPLPVAFGQMYSVVDLGTYSDTGGQTLSGPRAINRGGQIAGINVIGGSYQAMVYGGSWTNLGTLGGVDSYAAGINNLAQIAGYSSMDSTTTNAFLWTAGGTGGVPGNVQMQNLGTLGGVLSQGYAINQAGQITGYAQNSQNDRA